MEKMFFTRNFFAVYLIVVLFSVFTPISSTGAIPPYIPTSGLKAWYPLNGNANDSSGYGANGYSVGTVAWGTDRFGNLHSCYLGDGAGGFNIPSTNLPVGDHSRSVSVWYRSVIPYPGGPRMFISWGNNASLGQRFGVFAEDTLIGMEYINGHVEAHFTHDSVWHNLIVTYTSGGSSGVSVYIDGVHQSTYTYAAISSFNTDTGTIHAIGTLFLSIYYSWVGSIDDIGVWDRALTSCEIWQIAHSTLDSAGTGAVTGGSTLCIGASLTLTADTSGGTWTSSNTSVATVNSSTGVVTGVSPGTDTIFYTNTISCGAIVSEKIITVGSSPAAGTITGSAILCAGSSTSFSVSGGSSGGDWSSRFPGIATVSSSGIVTGIASGIDTIYYSVTSSCGTSSTRDIITINPLPDPGVITGTSTICTGTSSTLSESVTGGTWNSSDISIATVSSAGVVTPVATGSATISYLVTGTCGSSVAMKIITIISSPSAGIILGFDKLCPGDSITLTDTATGGTWSSSDITVATVTNSGGVVYGVSAGTAIISYTVSSTCGSAVATLSVVVFPAPYAGVVSGAASVCVGASVILTDTTSGGVWYASNYSVANTGGLITGVTAGVDTISYNVLTVCGVDSAKHIVTVVGIPNAGTIAIIESSICSGDTILLNDAAAGGTWISGNTGIATISSSGLATGVAGGTDTVFYIVANACGSDTATATVTVLSSAICHEGILSNTEIASKMNIFPNPNNGTYTVSVSSVFSEEMDVIVTNVLGEQIYEGKIATNTSKGMQQTMLPGVYFIAAIGDHERFRTTIVVE